MGYPAAYRTAVARDYSGSGAVRDSFQQFAPQPANDNAPAAPRARNDWGFRLPQAVNDNFPREAGRAVAYEAGKFALRKLAPRLVPYLGWGLTALDLGLWVYRHWKWDESPMYGAQPYWVPGWTLELDCGDTGGDHRWKEVATTYGSCTNWTGLGAIPSATNANTGVAVVLRSGVSWYQQERWSACTFGFGFWTGGHPWQHWARPVDPNLYIMQVPIRNPGWSLPGVSPNPDPRTDPMSEPVARPLPHPRPRLKPIPTRYPPNPWRSPVEQPLRGPVPVPPPGVLGTVTELTPGGKVVHEVDPVREPVKPGDKEVKLKTNIPHSVLRWVIDQATEWRDFVNAIYTALPRKLRGKLYADSFWGGPQTYTPQDRAYLIWLYWDQIDWNQALVNLVENEIEDAIVGAIGKLGRRTNQLRADFAPDGQSGIGVQTGPAL